MAAEYASIAAAETAYTDTQNVTPSLYTAEGDADYDTVLIGGKAYAISAYVNGKIAYQSIRVPIGYATPYITIDDLPYLPIERFDNAKGDGVKNCTLALQQAINEAITQEYIPVMFTNRYGNKYIVDADNITAPNGNLSTIVLQGVGGSKNTQIFANSPSGATTTDKQGYFLIAGDAARETPNAQQDFAGLEIRDLAILGDGKIHTMLGLEWRYSGITLSNVRVEGFKHAVSPVHDDPKSWTLKVHGGSYVYNDVDFLIHDHALLISGGARLVGGQHAVHVVGNASMISIIGNDLELQSGALVKMEGGASGLEIIGNYTENGYDIPGGHSTSAFAVNRHGTGTQGPVTPGGLLELIDDGGVSADSGNIGINIFANTIALLDAPWAFKIVNAGGPSEHLWGMEVNGNTLTKSATNSGTVFHFEGDCSNVKNIYYRKNNVTSNGTWAAHTNEGGHFAEIPQGFGPDATSPAPETWTNAELDDIASDANTFCKYPAKFIFNTPTNRLLLADSDDPKGTWNSVTSGATVRTPEVTAAQLTDITSRVNTFFKIKFLDNEIPLDSGGTVWALGPLPSDGWSNTQGGSVDYQPV